MPSFVGTVVPSSARGGSAELLVALRDGFARVDIESGALTALANPDGVPTNRWNDGKCSPEGRFWAGTMGAPGLVKDGVGGLYVLDRDEVTARRAVSGVTISNGLAWSADGKTMYYIDTVTGRVDAFDYDAATGALANRREAFKIPEGTGHPDGCCMDADGNLWIAQWGGWRVVAYRPENGAVVAEVRVPAANVSSCTFGGPGLADLYITTAKEHLTDEERAAQPLAGHCFIVKNCGFKGVPANVFRSERA
jgi:sugar lactone lactonase YvrE